MGAIRTYFRFHRWQRRLLVLLLTLIVGCTVGWGAMLVYWNSKVILALGQGAPAERSVARERAYQLGLLWKSTQWALLHTLDTPDDRRFLDVADVLERLEVFDSDRVAPRWRDRRRQVYFSSFQPPEETTDSSPVDFHLEARAQLLREFILADRWNQYTEEALRAAQQDPAPSIRRMATTLAGIHHQSDSLRGSLRDQSPAVVSVAAWNIALANQSEALPEMQAAWTDRIAQVAAQSTSRPADADSTANAQAMASLAIAIHRLGGSVLPEIVALLAQEIDSPVREYLYLTLGQLNNDAVPDLLRQQLHGIPDGKQPSPLLLGAAARHHLAEAKPFARTILQQAGQTEPPTDLLEAHALAALEVADATEMNIARELIALLDQHWGPDRPILLREAAFALGRQLPSAEDDPALRQSAIEILQQASLYEFSSDAADGGVEVLTTPLPSAAAAAAYWLADPADTQVDFKTIDAEAGTVEMLLPKNAAFFARQVAASDNPIAGDLLAWRIGRSDRPEAFSFGKTLLKGPAENIAEYDPDARVTGAMLLALAARTPAQKQDALAWIQKQADRELYLARVTMQATTAILDSSVPPEVLRTLVLTNNAPLRRGLTLLLASGQQDVLESLFWGGLWSDARLNSLLGTENFSDVLDAYLEGLSQPSLLADVAMRFWQMDRLRIEYAHWRVSNTGPVDPRARK